MVARRSLPVEAGQVVIPVMKVAGSVIGLVLVVIAAASAYYQILARIDRIDHAVTQQALAMTSVVESIKVITERSLTESDLRAACMQMQIANQGRGWVCPFSGVDIKAQVVTVRQKPAPAAAKPATAPPVAASVVPR
jgi:hypothetical protein